MNVVVLHNEVSREPTRDEEDVLVQVEAVCGALSDLGHDPVAVPFSLDLAGARKALDSIRPGLVFNLVESVDGAGRLIHLAPALLDHMRLPYTGARTEAIYLTSNKLLAKEWLKRSDLPTPAWITRRQRGDAPLPLPHSCIVKSVWEHASVGLDDSSVIHPENLSALTREMERRKEALGGDCFAEAFIEGRELNLSLLEGREGPQLLPPAEIRFEAYPEDRPKVVGYRAKWDSDSFEYHHTQRVFDFPQTDEPLLSRLGRVAKECWRAFQLTGYARVDFRVDGRGEPWVLEVNTNPCLSPDAGFFAAALHAGLSYRDLVGRIIGHPLRDARSISPGGDTFPGDAESPGEEPVQWREEVQSEDPEHIRNIVESSGFFSPREVSVAVELVEERLNKGIECGYHFLFAQTRGRVVGYACFGPVPCTQSSYDLYWIAVHNSMRRKGLGKTMMERTERTIAAQGGTRVYVETSSRSQYEPTRAFYTNRGYSVDAVLKDFYSPGDDKVVLVKRIVAPGGF